jgi:hypothetical protein
MERGGSEGRKEEERKKAVREGERTQLCRRKAEARCKNLIRKSSQVAAFLVRAGR